MTVLNGVSFGLDFCVQFQVLVFLQQWALNSRSFDLGDQRQTLRKTFFSHLCILYGSIVRKQVFSLPVVSTFSASNVYWFLACLQQMSQKSIPELLSSKLLWFDLQLHTVVKMPNHKKKCELFWGSTLNFQEFFLRLWSVEPAWWFG